MLQHNAVAEAEAAAEATARLDASSSMYAFLEIASKPQRRSLSRIMQYAATQDAAEAEEKEASALPVLFVRSFVLILTQNNGSELKNKCVGKLSQRDTWG